MTSVEQAAKEAQLFEESVAAYEAMYTRLRRIPHHKSGERYRLLELCEKLFNRTIRRARQLSSEQRSEQGL